MDLDCHADERRALARAHKNAEGRQDIYGLDYLEVEDDELTLTVTFLGKLPPALRPAERHAERQDRRKLKEHMRIEGGQRIRDIQVVEVTPHHDPNPERDDTMQVRVDRAGDFSTYRLRLVDVPGVDPRLAALDLSFKIDCPSDLDCAVEDRCPPRRFDQPEINYLAKDYASFRQLVLDRLSLLMPEWRERHVPDLELALVELLAYVGDYMSYTQDAVATEAYLDTARRRISVRRHTRLVDYTLHEGNNARAWVHLRAARNTTLDPRQVAFLAGLKGLLPGASPFVTADQLAGLETGAYEVFEPLVPDRALPIHLYASHNEIRFYTWGDRECCLSEGTTRATLLDTWEAPDAPAAGKQTAGAGPKGRPEYRAAPPPPTQGAERPRKLKLRTGDFLLFEEIAGPKTGLAADAMASHCHIVRLTRVEAKQDELVTVPESGLPTPVLEIEWSREDALPFPLCISSLGEAPACEYIEPVSVARGNLILVDQGQTVWQDLDRVPSLEVSAECDCEGHAAEVELRAGRFNPRLASGPLVYAERPPYRSAAAARFLSQDPHRATPAIALTSTGPDTQASLDWKPVSDLLGSGPDDPSFIVETDDDRAAHLRFGDGDLGLAARAGASFRAQYRVARSSQSGFGRGAIAHLTTSEGFIADVLEVRNPVAARGPVAPQPVKEAKLLAPGQFKKELMRAITGDDYSQIAGRELTALIQRAATDMAWTGSWYEADVALDPLGREHSGFGLLDRAEDTLDVYRRLGHDLRAQEAVYVPLDIALRVCVKAEYLRGHVEAAVEEVLSNRTLPGGRLGFFHPTNLTFGQKIPLSRLVAEAQAVTGVESVQVTRLQRLFESPNGELDRGYLALGPLEIPRLDNDPSFPEQGRLTLDIQGGR